MSVNPKYLIVGAAAFMLGFIAFDYFVIEPGIQRKIDQLIEQDRKELERLFPEDKKIVEEFDKAFNVKHDK